MIPVYIAFGIVVLVLILIIALLVYLLVRQQEQHNKVQDDLNNRLMTSTWEDYAVNRRADAADKGPRRANWKPDPDQKDPNDKTPDYHPELGAIR